jgi:amidase
MDFREYGKYDGIGLADLVRKKQVSAAELLDEAITLPGSTQRSTRLS